MMNNFINIGTIDNFGYISEETIGRNIQIKNKGETNGPVNIDVYQDEGDYLPHLHISSNNFKDGDCCLRLGSAAYFVHGHHRTKLAKAQMKCIDKWLKERNKDNPNITNFKMCCIVWNKSRNNELKIDENSIQPAYYTLGR